MYIQVFLSITAPAVTNYTIIGSIINGRKLIRTIIDSSELKRFIQVLWTNGSVPHVVGIQLPDGTDYDSETYPRQVQEYNSFLPDLNIFNNGLQITEQTSNTGAGWEPFNLT